MKTNESHDMKPAEEESFRDASPNSGKKEERSSPVSTEDIIALSSVVDVQYYDSGGICVLVTSADPHYREDKIKLAEWTRDVEDGTVKIKVLEKCELKDMKERRPCQIEYENMISVLEEMFKRSVYRNFLEIYLKQSEDILYKLWLGKSLSIDKKSVPDSFASVAAKMLSHNIRKVLVAWGYHNEADLSKAEQIYNTFSRTFPAPHEQFEVRFMTTARYVLLGNEEDLSDTYDIIICDRRFCHQTKRNIQIIDIC